MAIPARTPQPQLAHDYRDAASRDALLADSPSLRATLPDVLAASYRAARDDSVTETGLLDLPENPPFTVEQALNDPPTD